MHRSRHRTAWGDRQILMSPQLIEDDDIQGLFDLRTIVPMEWENAIMGWILVERRPGARSPRCFAPRSGYRWRRRSLTSRPARRAPPSANAKLTECGAPELEWDGAAIELHRTISCDQGDEIGPFHGGNTVVLHTVVVPADGSFELAVIGDGPSSVALQQCGGCEAHAAPIAAAGLAPATATLPAGRYSLRLLASAPDGLPRLRCAGSMRAVVPRAGQLPRGGSCVAASRASVRSSHGRQSSGSGAASTGRR